MSLRYPGFFSFTSPTFLKNQWKSRSFFFSVLGELSVTLARLQPESVFPISFPPQHFSFLSQTDECYQQTPVGAMVFWSLS